jgi:phage baseplate assembly protein gpV
MNITIKKRNGENLRSPQHLNQANPYDKRYGAWGHVADVDGDQKSAYSDDNSVDVILDMGVYLRHIPVASREWVVTRAVSGADYTTGERDLPPPNARVFVMMPTGTFDDCFVLCSGFAPVDKNDNVPFADDETEKKCERIRQGGWHTIYDCVTGTYEAVSPDEKTSLKIDYGTEEEAKDKPELHVKLFEKTTLDIIDEDSANLSVFDGEVKIEHKKGDNAKITVFDTELTIKKGEVSVKPKKTTIEVDGDAEIKTSGKTTIEATGDTTVKGKNVNVEATAKVTVKAPQVLVTGGQFQVNGTAAPSTGPFCGLPNCLFTGAPHGGNIVQGT